MVALFLLTNKILHYLLFKASVQIALNTLFIESKIPEF